MESRPGPLGPESFTYDAEGRVLTFRVGGTERARYEYDAEGRRIRKIEPAGSTEYVYDADGNLAAEYGGTPVMGVRYLTVDHLGSTRLVTDGAGQVRERIDYHPFGEQLLFGSGNGREGVAGFAAGAEVRQRFTGQERDGESGLDYFGARYFSAAQGRFTRPDKPFVDQYVQDPQSWNMYAYVRNNPLALVDDHGTQARKPVPNMPGYTYRGDLTNPHDNPNFHIFNRKGHEIGRISVQEAYTGTILESGNRETAMRLMTEGNVPQSVVRQMEGLVQSRRIQPRFAAAGGPFSGFTIRGVAVLSMLSILTNAIADHKLAQTTGVLTTIFGENKILDPTKAAESLGAGTIIQYTDKAGKSQFYTVSNGQFVRAGCNQKRENCGISNPSDGSFKVVNLQ